jgi:AcrR family transcriptional regulator
MTLESAAAPSRKNRVSVDDAGGNLRPPGVGALPAKQLRSRELRDRLIANGRALVEAGGFAKTSMADIARASGCSTGALYFRFRDKEALFDCVVDSAMSEAVTESVARVAEGRYRNKTVPDTIATCVGDFVDFVRANEGMVRALYQRALHEPRHFAPMRHAALSMTGGWCDAIAANADRSGDEAFTDELKVAFQFASAVLVHAVISDPPYVQLHSDAMKTRLIEMVSGFAQQPPGADAVTPRRGRAR